MYSGLEKHKFIGKKGVANRIRGIVEQPDHRVRT